MCLTAQEKSTKARRMMKAGYLCLAAGLLLQQFAHPSGATAQNWLHGVIGFLMGISIVAMLAGVRFSRPRA